MSQKENAEEYLKQLDAAFHRQTHTLPGMHDSDAELASRQEPPGKDAGGYVAFDAKDKVERLRIRRAGGFTRAPAYAHLADIVSDGEKGSEIVLMFHFLTVTVSGHNLQGLLRALELGTAEFVQEYDRNRWPRPEDPAAAFIAAIEIAAQGLIAAAGQTEEMRATPARENAP